MRLSASGWVSAEKCRSGTRRRFRRDANSCFRKPLACSSASSAFFFVTASDRDLDMRVPHVGGNFGDSDVDRRQTRIVHFETDHLGQLFLDSFGDALRTVVFHNLNPTAIPISTRISMGPSNSADFGFDRLQHLFGEGTAGRYCGDRDARRCCGDPDRRSPPPRR